MTISAFGVDHGRSEVAKYELIRPKSERKAVLRSKGYWGSEAVALGGLGAGIAGASKMKGDQGIKAGFKALPTKNKAMIAGGAGAYLGGVGAAGVAAHRAGNKQRKKEGKPPRSYWSGQPKKVQKSAFGVEDHVEVSKLSASDVKRKASSKATKENTQLASAGVVGGAAAQGAYQGAAYGPKRAIRRYYGHNKKLSEMSSDAKISRAGQAKTRLASSKIGQKLKIKPVVTQRERKKGWETAKKAQAKKGIHPSGATKPTFWRTLPKEAPFYKTQRVLGYTHTGRLGNAVGAGATVAGAAGGVAAMRHHQKKKS